LKKSLGRKIVPTINILEDERQKKGTHIMALINNGNLE